MVIQQKHDSTTSVVFSPDDGGYWLSQFDIDRERNRASKKVYATMAEAVREFQAGKVKWERWER